MSRFPVLLNEFELAAVLTGLRLVASHWTPEETETGPGFYTLPGGASVIMTDGGALEPLALEDLNRLAARLNGPAPAPLPLPETVESIRSLLVQIVQYEAERFDGPADQDLNVSGADLVDWFTEIRKDAYEAVEKLDLALPVSGAYPPPASPMIRLFSDEGGKDDRSPVIVTFKGGLTHPFESWSYGAGFLVGDGPNGSRIVCDVTEIALAHFVDEIPAPMLQGAYGIFPEDETIKAPRTLDGD